MTGFLDGDSSAPTNIRSAGLEASINIGTVAGISRRKYSIELASCLPRMFWAFISIRSRPSKARIS